MKQYAKYLIKKRGINWFIGVKAMYLYKSDGLFPLYDNLKMCLHYKKDNDYVLYNLDWELSMQKDYAQYQF